MSQPTTSPAASEGSDLPAKLAPPRLVTPEAQPPASAPAAPSVFDHMNEIADDEAATSGPAATTGLSGPQSRPSGPARAAVTADSFVPRRMILQVNRSGAIVEVDWATTAALGWPSDELIGSSIFDWIHPSEIEESRRSWSELVAASGSGRRLKARFWHRDGRWLWVEQTDRNLLDDAAGTIISELVDITPEVEAQHALEARNQVLAVLSESPSTGIIEIAPDQRVEFVNREWFAAAGLAEGAPFVAFLATLTDRDRVQRALSNAQASGLESRFSATRTDGSQVDIRVQPLPTTSGERNGVIALDATGSGETLYQQAPVRPPTPVTATPPVAAAPIVQPAQPAQPAQPTPAPVDRAPEAPVPAPSPNLPVRRLPVPALIPPEERARQRLRERQQPPTPEPEAKVAPIPIVLGQSTIEYSESTELAVVEEPKPDTGRLTGWAGFALPEMLVTLVIGVGALFVRLWQLSGVPAGLHREEGFVALAAQGVTNGISAGLWDTNQPTLHIWSAAPALAVFGDSISALRVMSAFVGVLTVASLFIVARPRFGRRAAIAAAAVLSLLTWHVHYSRLALGSIWWPLVGLAAAALTVRALQTRSQAVLVAAGFMTGLGVYVAFEHWVFVFAVLAFFVGWLASTARERPVVATLIDFALFTAALVVTVAWMVRHLGSFLSWSDLATFMNVLALRFDDGIGIIAPVSIVIIAAAAVGVLIALVGAITPPRERNPFLLLSLVLIGAYGLAVLVLDNVDAWRQTFVLAPFVALLAGTGFAWAFQFLARTIGRVGAWSFATLVGLVFALTSVPSYFGDFSGDAEQRQLFGADYVEVADLVNDTEGDPIVEVIVNDSSAQLSAPQLPFLTDGRVRADGLPADSSDESNRPRLFVVIGEDAPQVELLQSIYPTGAISAEGVGDLGRYVAFSVPSPAGGGGQ